LRLAPQGLPRVERDGCSLAQNPSGDIDEHVKRGVGLVERVGQLVSDDPVRGGLGQGSERGGACRGGGPLPAALL
jgi:hypothetical protein